MAALPSLVAQDVEDAFTPEQQQYIAGFLLAVAKQGDASSTAPVPAETAEPTWFGTPVEDLCQEELWKYQENPLDLWDKLLAHAAENRFPTGGDVFRFKFHGLFHVAPAQDAFMLRLRVPGCRLSASQLLGLAEMAEQWGGGEAHITMRGNLQIRRFQPKDIVRVLMKVQSLGLAARGSGADNVRNITATPTSGLDPGELLDVLPLAEALNYYILNSRDLYGLPRKFNVALDSGGAVGVAADTNDLAFIATRVGPGRGVAEGVYFRVQLGGVTGHRQFAGDAGVLVAPERTVVVAAAMLRVFNENGDRTDRKKARLKYLIERWGMDNFLVAAEKRLPYTLPRLPLSECEPRPAIDRHGHLGVHPQRQPGLAYLGAAVPVGRLSAAQMRAVAAIAERFGSGELRLTTWQNLILPNLPVEQVEAARQALATAGLNDGAPSFAAGTVACTGNTGCRYAATDTKAHALVLAEYLDRRFKCAGPINLHVTGCPHSCAQHYIGDIGLLGTKVGGEEGYRVLLGGGSDDRQGLGRELGPAVRFDQLPPLLEKLFRLYFDRRAPDESFLAFTRRHSIEQLQDGLRTEAS